MAKPKRKSKLKEIVHTSKLLRTSWNVQTKLFFEKSTLHGVRYISENGRPFIEKLSVVFASTVPISSSLFDLKRNNRC